MADDASRAVQGGAAAPVFITNLALPTSTPGGSQNVVVTSQPAPPTGASATQVQGPAAHDSPVVGNPLLNGAYASDTPPANVTLADIVRLWAKLNGALAVFNAYALNSTDDAAQAYPPATAQRVGSTALEASRVLKASPGTLCNLMIYNGNTLARFFLLFDSTTVPIDTTPPSVAPISVPALSHLVVSFPLTGLTFTTGIAICSSTTAATKTLGASDMWVTAEIL